MKQSVRTTLMALAGVMLVGGALAGVNPAYQTWLKRKQAGHLPKAETVVVTNAVTQVARPKTAMSSAKRNFAAAPVTANTAMLAAAPTPMVVPLALAPNMLDTSYLSDVNNVLRREPVGGYPSKFDLRDYNQVTPAKNQGSTSDCWAYSAIAAVESSALYAGWSSPDFSEAHMSANRLYDRSEDGMGNDVMAEAYLLRGAGPVNEGETRPACVVRQSRWIPARKDGYHNDDIKDAIWKFGPVVAMMYWTPVYYLEEHCCYYNMLNLLSRGNHSVTIIGWDDDFSPLHFASKPINKGAWIVKNSLGPDWGDGGCFYVSYHDLSLGYERMIAYPTVESPNAYGTIYQYDEFGCTAQICTSTRQRNTAYGANIFTPEIDDTLSAVGFYALAPNTQYEITIYAKINENADTNGRPTTGKPVLRQSGTCNYAGFWTVPLEEYVDVNAGEPFSVVVKFVTPNLTTPLPIEYNIKGSVGKMTSAAGQSFYSERGGSWNDLANSQYKGANVCIKAYGIGDDDDWHVTKVELEGPLAVVAGQTGTFLAWALYSDGYRMTNDAITIWSVTQGAAAVELAEEYCSNARVTVKSDLTENVGVVLSATVDGEFTDEISFTATAVKPEAPVNLTATAGTTPAGVRLRWDGVANAAQYSVYRNDGQGPIRLEAVRTTEYTDTEATPGVDYTYTVKAENGAGFGPASAAATGWRKLAAPENLVASDGEYDYVQLTWAPVDGAKAYQIYRSDDLESEMPTNLTTVSEWIDALSFRDTPPEKGIEYVYFVRAAVDAAGTRESDLSVLDYGSRKVPVRLAAVVIEGPVRVNAGETATYTGYAVMTDGSRVDVTDGFSWTVDGETVQSASYTLTTQPVATSQTITIGLSLTIPDSDGVPVTKTDERQIALVPVVPAVPGNPAVTRDGAAGIRVEWKAIAGASAYRIYRNDELIATVTDGALTYLDATVRPGVPCAYRVTALNVAGESAKSAPSESVVRDFSAPSFVSATSDGKESVTVTWQEVVGAKAYRVGRRDSATGETRILSDWIAELTFADESAAVGDTYWYVVQAAELGGAGASAWSAPTIGTKTAAQTLAFITLGGPGTIAYNGEGTFDCVATYANGVERQVNPVWSFKASHELVTVDASGRVRVGFVTGEDLELTLQARYEEDGVVAEASIGVKVIAFVPQVASVAISNVIVRARWPWNGIVDITYDLYSVPATTRAVVTVLGHDYDLGEDVRAATVTGEGIDSPAAGGNPHRTCRITWNVGQDVTNFHSSAFSVTLDAAPFAVAAPVDVRASDGTSSNAVEVAWEKSFGAVGYEVWRSTVNDSESAVRIAAVENGATAYADETATAGETYYYWVKTVAGEFSSDVSDFSEMAVGKRALPPQAPADIESDIAAYYPFNGDCDDWSGNRLDLTETDGVRFVAGHDGEATAFDGKLELGGVTNATLTGSFAFAAWVKPSRETALCLEGSSAFSANAGYVLGPQDLSAAGKAGFGVAVGSNGVGVFEGTHQSIPCTLSCPLALGTTWHLVVVSVEANGAPVLFVDGVYVKTGLATCNVKALPVGVALGGCAFGHFAGELDDVVYYARALKAQDAAELFKKGHPAFTGQDRVSTPTVTVAPVDATTVRVTLGCATRGATIRYSIDRRDGGDTVDDREYTVGFDIRGNARVSAYAVKDGWLASARVVKEITQAWEGDAKEALGDDTNVTYSTTLGKEWTIDTSVTSDGGAASMRSGKIGANEASALTAKFSGAGRFTFDWKVSSEANFDVLKVEADGVLKDQISGRNGGWVEKTLVFHDGGAHTVVWTYVKDNSTNLGQDCGWVDRVTWMPAGSQTVSPVVDVSHPDESREATVSVGCETAGATIYVKWVDEDSGAVSNWVYNGTFTIEGDGVLTVVAQVDGLFDSEPTTVRVRRPWLVRMRDALVGDKTTFDAVAFSPYYYSMVDEKYWWDDDKAVTGDGGYSSAKSAAIPDAEKGDVNGIGTSLFAEFEGKGTLTFKWKVDSEAGWDVLTYYGGEDYDDYSYAESISGDRDWADMAITFSTDYHHVFEWEYNKDDSNKNGRDAGWIDALVWHPARFAPAAPPARTGYTFAGYAQASDGEVVYKPGEQLAWNDATVDFYEVWTPHAYTVRFMATLASVDDSADQAFVYEADQALKAASAFVFESNFLGWTDTANGTNVVYTDGQTVKNLTSEDGGVVLLYPVLETEPDNPPALVGDWYVAKTGNDANAGTREAPFLTIQKALDVASANQTVLVGPGTYKQNLNIMTSGLSILAENGPTATTIEGDWTDAVVRIRETATGAELRGFTIIHGRGNGSGNVYGGAVDAYADSVIRDCIMHDNGNSGTYFAGAVHGTNRAKVLLTNCLMYGNYAWACGGATLVEGESVMTVDHCTVAANRSTNFIGYQGGLSVANTGTLIVTNTIAYGNEGLQIAAYGSYYGRESTLRVIGSCVQGGVAANGAGNFRDLGGNFSSDPKFVTEDGVPYIASDVACEDVGFSLKRLTRYSEQKPKEEEPKEEDVPAWTGYTLGNGLDATTNYVWTSGYTGDGGPWGYNSDASFSYDGVDCVNSGGGGGGHCWSWLETTIEGPCTVSFMYKVSTYYGDFDITLDGSTSLYHYSASICLGGWTPMTLTIPAGTHRLRFQYHHPAMGWAYKFNGVALDRFTVTK